MTRLLIAGATGLVGGLALQRALADPRVARVIAPTRRALEPHPKLDNPLVDFAALPDAANWWAVDGAIGALGTTRASAGSAAAFRRVDFEIALDLARRVRAAGATRFALTSSMGANPRSHLLYPRTKGELEDAVRALGFPSLTIVRPGLLGGDRHEFRAGERVAAAILRAATPVLPRRYRISPADAVARMLVDAAIAAPPGVAIVEADRLAAP
jgi:uncharacterized protein YbjT (DUF2867 family)